MGTKISDEWSKKRGNYSSRTLQELVMKTTQETAIELNRNIGKSSNHGYCFYAAKTLSELGDPHLDERIFWRCYESIRPSKNRKVWMIASNPFVHIKKSFRAAIKSVDESFVINEIINFNRLIRFARPDVFDLQFKRSQDLKKSNPDLYRVYYRNFKELLNPVLIYENDDIDLSRWFFSFSRFSTEKPVEFACYLEFRKEGIDEITSYVLSHIRNNDYAAGTVFYSQQWFGHTFLSGFFGIENFFYYILPWFPKIHSKFIVHNIQKIGVTYHDLSVVNEIPKEVRQKLNWFSKRKQTDKDTAIKNIEEVFTILQQFEDRL